MNKVSVIIPVYNLESKLEQTLHSIIGQTFSDMEIVIVDDASDDNSLAEALGILRDSGKLYKIIKHEKNLGVSTSRNDGLRVSGGEYVVFVDGDDMLEKDFVSVLYAALDSSHGDYAACGYQVLESRTGAREKHFLDVDGNLGCHDILAGRILNKIEISHCATLYRRDFLVKNNLLYTDGCIAGEDIEFLIKMLCHSPRGVFIRDCMYIYVQHSGMGSRKGVTAKAGKLQRYEHHTEAHFREAEYIMEHTQDKTLAVLAENMILPLAHLRRLSICAMKNDKKGFANLLQSQETRNILAHSYKSILYKPEVFLRSLIALLAPSLYYKKYSHYLDR